MVHCEPFSGHPIVATDRVEEAEFLLSKSLVPTRFLRVADRSRFALRMNGVRVGRASLVFNRYGVDTDVAADLVGGPLFFALGNGTPTTIHLKSGPIVVAPGQAAVIAGADRMRIERPDGSELLILHVGMSDLHQHLERLAGRPSRATLAFESSVTVTSGPGAALKRMVEYLSGELEHDEHLLENSGLCQNYEQLLLTALLSLPHSLRERLDEERHRRLAPELVGRAEGYLRAHLTESITITELLQRCGCGRSALFAAFRDVRGYTPMEFLTEQRLQLVRERLRRPEEWSSVTSIALDSGFRHLGRFSGAYRRRFGESPSETLRRGRDAVGRADPGPGTG